MTLAAIASAAALAYPIIDAMIKEKNSKKAAAKKQQLDAVLARYNLKLDNLRNRLEKMGVDYNALQTALQYSSPASKGHQMLKKKAAEYYKAAGEIPSTIASTNELINQYTALENQKINNLESKGVIRTILHKE